MVAVPHRALASLSAGPSQRWHLSALASVLVGHVVLLVARWLVGGSGGAVLGHWHLVVGHCAVHWWLAGVPVNHSLFLVSQFKVDV